MENSKTIENLLSEKNVSRTLLESKLKEVTGLKKVNKEFLTKVLSLNYIDYKIMKESYKEGQKGADKGSSFVIAVVVTIFFSGFVGVFSKLDFMPAFLIVSIYALISMAILIGSFKGNGILEECIKIFKTIDILIDDEKENQPKKL